jgi:hypothetical protein
MSCLPGLSNGREKSDEKSLGIHFEEYRWGARNSLKSIGG